MNLNTNGIPVAIGAVVLGLVAVFFAPQIVRFSDRLEGRERTDRERIVAIRMTRLFAVFAFCMVPVALFIVG